MLNFALFSFSICALTVTSVISLNFVRNEIYGHSRFTASECRQFAEDTIKELKTKGPVAVYSRRSKSGNVN